MNTMLEVLPSLPDTRHFSSTELAKQTYFALSQANPEAQDRAAARAYLHQQLSEASALPVDLPESIDAFAGWIEQRTAAVGLEYRRYLAERKSGAPRRYFGNKAHALYFLRTVAPTKLVDGSWLYGLLPRWNDPDFQALITIYLEELGEGVAEKNHVVLYKKLLATHGCDQWQDLNEEHFVQGAIQLALAYDAEHFLPELIGYNLGYEQLPLHLLITSFELNELGIDPYYFTLHVTVDNAATGHALKALEGLQQIMPRVGDQEAFYRRVMAGYSLNDLGANTMSVITSFDLEQELVAMLAAKSVVGKNMHSDYCRIAGRTVNDWLSSPEQIPAFLRQLENNGWIKRGEAPENSRFWRLIQGERAEMFGVFTAYEQQVLQDWITTPAEGSTETSAAPHILTHRARQRMLETLAQPQDARPRSARGLIRHHFGEVLDGVDGPGSELRLLESRLADAGSKDEAIGIMIGLMSPASHHSSAGLMATRIFNKLFNA